MRARVVALALVFALVFSVSGIASVPAAGSAGGLPLLDGSSFAVPKSGQAGGSRALDQRLAGLAEYVQAEGERSAVGFAKAAGLEYEYGRVTVVVEVDAGQHAPVRAALKAFGAEETGSYEDLIRARVPVGVLNALSRQAGVRNVRPPIELRPVENVPVVGRTPATREVPEERSKPAFVAPQSVSDTFAHGFETWPGPWNVWSESGPTWGRTTYRQTEGTYSAYCAASSIAAPGPYANDMQAWLWTEPIDLSGLSEATLSFDLYHVIEADYDVLFVGLSTDDVSYDGFFYDGNSGGWVTEQFDLADLYDDGTTSFTGESEVYLAFIFATDESVTYEGAYVDNVRITAGSPPPPPPPVEVTSQGVEETNASALHLEGIDGTGVKVGIIDSGFYGYQGLLGTELPASVQTWGGGSLGPEGNGSEVHGTAVTEIVYDMAPGASLYLAQAADEVDMGNAASWMASQGVKVINMSMGVTIGPKDGSGAINDVVNTAVSTHGMFWANAAGNEREYHWGGDWVEQGGSLAWASGTNLQRFDASAGEWAVASLVWDDDWDAASQDYDLYLLAWTGAEWVVVGNSIEEQSGQPGHEPIEFVAASLPYTTTYTWAVFRYSATRSDVGFDFNDWLRPLEYQETAGSLCIPADNPSSGFMAAAAIGRAPGFAQEPYSSEGPTRDGRLAPEIAMPAAVDNSVYGDFTGTSAASPHLAGAAALVKQSNAAYTPAQVENHLRGLTVDLGVAGPDSAYGYGRLWFDGEGPPPPPPDGCDFIPVAGAGRYETAVEASKLGWPTGSPVAVIATGRNWPDALGGATVAGLFDAPILLTARDSIPACTIAEMDRLGVEFVVVLGGEAAVSSTVTNTLVSKVGTGNVIRLSGDNRYETAWVIAWFCTHPDLVGASWDGTAFAATGANYPDALAAAPIAAAWRYPIFLISPRGLGDTGDIMEAIGVQRVVVLGGTSAVSSATEQALKVRFGNANVTRIPGATRYQTAVNVSNWGVTQKDMSWECLALATGQNYPDALTGGALQGRHGSVMLLTRSTSLSPEPATLLNQRKADISEVRFLGGLSSLSQGVRDSVTDIFE